MEAGFIEIDKINRRLDNLELFMKSFKEFMENLEFSKRTEEAFLRHEQGDFVEKNSDLFLEELEKW